MKSLSNILIILIIFFVFFISLLACAITEWKIPKESKMIKNPISSDENSITRGRELFEKRCVACHGKKGDGKGSMAFLLTRRPPDFNHDDIIGMMTDGEIFYKISKGNSPMPQWEKKLAENERWDLVNFIRTFAK